mmetsp:Transcript_27415/g.49372  ORF Transcript_27415/g.49372 Transcript_27415/m.49372 type:complete len:499 (+) Transcript_27415:464-1960(+)
MEVQLHPRYQGPMIIESYLKKAKQQSSFSRFLARFTKRWFTLDLTKGTLSYQKSKTSNRGLKVYMIKDLCNFRPEPEDAEVCNWTYPFSIQAKGREYLLHCETESSHSLWANALWALQIPEVRPPVQEQPKEALKEEVPVHAVKHEDDYRQGGAYYPPPPQEKYGGYAQQDYNYGPPDPALNYSKEFKEPEYRQDYASTESTAYSRQDYISPEPTSYARTESAPYKAEPQHFAEVVVEETYSRNAGRTTALAAPSNPRALRTHSYEQPGYVHAPQSYLRGELTRGAPAVPEPKSAPNYTGGYGDTWQAPKTYTEDAVDYSHLRSASKGEAPSYARGHSDWDYQESWRQPPQYPPRQPEYEHPVKQPEYGGPRQDYSGGRQPEYASMRSHTGPIRSQDWNYEPARPYQDTWDQRPSDWDYDKPNPASQWQAPPRQEWQAQPAAGDWRAQQDTRTWQDPRGYQERPEVYARDPRPVVKARVSEGVDYRGSQGGTWGDWDE